MILSPIIRIILILLAVTASPAAARYPAPVVLAAASMQEALTDAANVWARRMGQPPPVLSFAATSAQARQVEAGARADLIIAADDQWMARLAEKRLIVARSRAIIARNRLVIIAGRGTDVCIAAQWGKAVVAAIGPSRIAMADPDSVPAGRYGKAALEKLGIWQRLSLQMVRTENVRAALLLVERGAAPFGIVYATDAQTSAKVRVAGIFPHKLHPPIVYPAARLASSRNPAGESFRRFLLSPAGQAILARHGFGPR